jgi:uncharacterized protein (DUF1778 family)
MDWYTVLAEKRIIMVRTPARAKRERLEARITPEQKELFQRAAALSGRTISDFVVSSAEAAAEETIRNHQVVMLTAQDSIAFARTILNPPEPNKNLRSLAQRYHEFVGE